MRIMNTARPSRLAILGLLTLAGVLAACSSTGTNTVMGSNNDSSEPYHLMYLDHPLAGKIWSTREQRFITRPELVKQLAKNDYILLGETHDNIIHHKNEAWIIQRLAELNTNAGVAFEMIDDKQGEQMRQAKISSSPQLISLLEKDKTGWDYRLNYRAVFDSAFTAGFPIFSANISRNRLMTILSNGKEQLPTSMKQQLADNPLTEQQRADLAKEIRNSHCGMSTPSMTEAMILGQSLRDATMSNSLYANKQKGLNTMVLIAGSGHVRNDRGIPHYLRNSDKKAKILTIAWIEVYKGADEVKDYAKSWGDAGLPFDYVWFTPQADRPDPCEEMRKFMKKHKKGHTNPTPETRTI